MSDFDVCIIGGGPGGYVAAEQTANRGKRTVLIEQENIGGTCLNWGCIPTKSLIHSASLLNSLENGSEFGIKSKGINYQFSVAMDSKNRIVKHLRLGVLGKMERSGVVVKSGKATIVGLNRIHIGGNEIEVDHIVIATGAKSVLPPIPGADLPHVIDSNGALQLNALPKKIVIIGGGYIGIEFASYFHAVGVEVVLVEMQNEILAGMDSHIVQQFKKALPKVKWFLNSRVNQIKEDGVCIESTSGEVLESADLVLIAAGRVPNVDSSGMEKININFDHQGVKVDDQMRTNIPNVYAIGDVTGKSLLAHTAIRMGEIVADVICSGGKTQNHMRYSAIPWVIYTYPEIAGVGLTESDARKKGYQVKTGKLPLSANGRFIVEHGMTGQSGVRGFIKIVVNSRNNTLLGVQMIGSPASEIMFGAATLIEAELSVEEIREIIFPHPTVSEVLREVMWEIDI